MRVIKEYCCCAIPLLNAGIYITLTEQFVVAATAGILAFATPSIVGASVPGWVPTVFAILCFVAAAIQILGFLGVVRESTVMFRRYTTLHSMILLAVFTFSAVFIGISASKHSTAQAACITTFFPADSGATETALTGSDSEGKLLCNIFTWVGVGIMGALWVILAIFHAYLYFVISGYGSSQRDDHRKYYSLYSLNSYPGNSNPHPTFLPGSENIGLRNVGPNPDAWDTRDSMDEVGFEKQYPHAGGQYPNTQGQYPANPGAYPPRRQQSDASYYPDVEQAAPYHNNYTNGGHNAGYEDPYYNPNARHPGQ
ncbi:hypothetical protein M422DRAFT_176537 [Sphaerobolus stellatus SS14]|uniref:Unplaced genomic scaffold SPHSTscaffold_85, whole genome shotgun sequence n=1 Tax=Sphaerobolus stellatus (strain SS14) TaxID=990650 RepID=A0A0C9VA91_SPHS4|nr:hypothetical protein M422DRAFT_176537 [Sphaerobolus stellatus SS14]